MKKKTVLPDYSHQYDSFPRSCDSYGLDELRAWTVYEYARESRTILRLAEQHKKGEISPESGDALGQIKDFSVLVYKSVKAMGRFPSFSKPWAELSPALRRKLIASCRIPAVSIAPENVVRDCLGDCPALGAGRDITSKLSFGTDEPLRLLPLLLNAELSKAELMKGVTDFFEKELRIGGRRGRGASSKNAFSTALRELAVLRLISNRSLKDARKISSSMETSIDPPLIPKSGGERTWRRQIEKAQQTFRQLIFAGLQFSLQDEMLSYGLYKMHHPNGGDRWSLKKIRMNDNPRKILAR
jgi:hypothetical protein